MGSLKISNYSKGAEIQLMSCSVILVDILSHLKKEQKTPTKVQSSAYSVDSDTSSSFKSPDTESEDESNCEESEWKTKIASDPSDDFLQLVNGLHESPRVPLLSDDDDGDEKQTQKSAVKRNCALFASEETEPYSTASNDSYSDDSEKKLSKKYKKRKTDFEANSDPEEPEMTEYERMLARNRAEKLNLFKSLGIVQAKDDYSEAVGSMKRKSKPKKVTEKPDSVIKRTSNRRKSDVCYGEKELQINAGTKRQPNLPFSLTFKKVLKSERLYRIFVEDVGKPSACDETPILYDKNFIEQLTVTKSCKVSSPSAAAWFPFAENLALAIGSKYGELQIWNVKEEMSELHTFPVHSKKITNLKINPDNFFHLISSSIDGLLMCCDMQKHVFSKIFETRDGGVTDFDLISPSSYLVSLTDGHIALIDKRATRSRCGYIRRTCQDSLIRTINVHPVDKNYFVVGGHDRIIDIWDVRRISGTPVIQISDFKESISSALFSPISGNSILITSLDDTVRIFDCKRMAGGFVKLHKLMHTHGQSTRVNAAVWLPNSDDYFVFSDRVKPPSIQIFDKDLNVFESITDRIKGCRTFNTFHPFREAFACFDLQSPVTAFMYST